MQRAFHLLACLAAVACLCACPAAGDEVTVVETCTKTGEKCRIGDGQLGVCMMNSDGAYHCASQH